MATQNTQAVQFSGPYLIQDMDHMGLSNTQPAPKAKSGHVRQVEQSNTKSSSKRSGPRQSH